MDQSLILLVLSLVGLVFLFFIGKAIYTAFYIVFSKSATTEEEQEMQENNKRRLRSVVTSLLNK